MAYVSAILQIASVLVSVAVIASRTTSLHRYEAQVEGGRPAVLLTRPPPQYDSENTKPLLPIDFCLRNRVISLEMDCQMGKITAFVSWYFLIFGRILCLVISYKTHLAALIVFVLAHFMLMLLYLLSSQSLTIHEVPSTLFNVTISIIALVEVSVRFFKIPLLYTFFFICFFVEDTFLMILFFVYPPNLCLAGNLDCKYFGLCSYLIINSHVIGTIVFGIYLARFRPRKKMMTTSVSTVSIVSI